MRRQQPPENNLSQTRRLPCAAYTRTSSEEGLDSDFNSLDAQRESAEACIASQKHEGWEALSTRYDDAGYSGGTLERPALQRLLQDVEAGRIGCVVVYKVDRLSRSLLDFTRLIEVFDRNGVSFVSVTQQFNTTTPMGRLVLNILLSFAQFEREIIGERIRDKVAATKKKGKYCGGPPVLGYDVDRERKRLVVNPAEAELVRHIFEGFVQTGSTTALAHELNDQGYITKSWITKKGTTRAGGPWNKGHLYRLLNNPLYVGEVAHGELRYPGEQEPIVSGRLWEQAHAVLSHQYRAPGVTTRAKTEALLRGILRCAHCGCAMGPTFTRRRGKVYHYYLCVHASKNGHDSCPTRCLSAGEIESTVVDQLRRVLRAPEMLAQTYREARAQAEEASQCEAFSEQKVIDTLCSLDPIWEHLFPQEQERIVRLLVKRVDVYPDRAEVQIRAEGLASLVAELRENEAEQEVEA
jgi:DNA invertase Pin-like site-specific DNA recombinase